MVFDQAGERLILLTIIHDFGNGPPDIVNSHFLGLFTDEDELLPLLVWQRAQQHGVHDAEDGSVRANAESKRENGDRRIARIVAHHTEGIAAVLTEYLPVFARRRAKDSGDRLAPQLQEIHKASSLCRLAALFLEDARHFAFVIRAKIERENLHKEAEELL